MTTMMIYDADLPIHMKGGMVKLKQTVESIINKNTDFESLSSIILELDNELTFGLNQIRNHGYITEGVHILDQTRAEQVDQIDMSMFMKQLKKQKQSHTLSREDRSPPVEVGNQLRLLVKNGGCD